MLNDVRNRSNPAVRIDTVHAYSIMHAMPDDSRPPRHVPDDPPTLGARALMRQLEELVKAHGLVGARVRYKRNPAGEHVVAIVFASFPAQ